MTFAPVGAANELKGLRDVLLAARDHHDESKPEIRHSLAALAESASRVTGDKASLFEILLSNPAVIAALLALLERKLGGAPAPQPVPPIGQPPTVAPGTPSGPIGSGPQPALLYPTDLRIDFDLFDHEGAPLAFRVEEKADCYEVVKLDGTSNLPLHSKALLRAGYCLNGVPFKFEDQTPPALHLYHTARWVAREVGGKGRVSTLKASGKVYAQTNGKGGRIVNWNSEAEEPREATRTGGMDVPMKLPAEANDAVVEVNLEVDTPAGTIRHDKPIRFPKAS